MHKRCRAHSVGQVEVALCCVESVQQSKLSLATGIVERSVTILPREGDKVRSWMPVYMRER